MHRLPVRHHDRQSLDCVLRLRRRLTEADDHADGGSGAEFSGHERPENRLFAGGGELRRWLSRVFQHKRRVHAYVLRIVTEVRERLLQTLASTQGNKQLRN